MVTTGRLNASDESTSASAQNSSEKDDLPVMAEMKAAAVSDDSIRADPAVVYPKSPTPSPLLHTVGVFRTRSPNKGVEAASVKVPPTHSSRGNSKCSMAPLTRSP